VHRLYRRDTLSVQQPHSVPLQFLAETGLVGAALALAAAGLLLAGAVGSVRAVRSVRAETEEHERLLAAALLAGVVAYAVHELYDWDWDIPGVTIPVLLFLGVLGGSLARRRRGDRQGGEVAGPRSGVGVVLLRALALVAAALGVAAFALSVVIPRVAAHAASQALVSASTASSPQLRDALNSARAASRLDPLSDAGLRAASTISLHLGQRAQARRYLLAAVARDPSDGAAWQELAYEDFALRDDREALAAARRARALDPEGTIPVALAQAAMLTLGPPSGSATAVGTPSSHRRACSVSHRRACSVSHRRPCPGRLDAGGAPGPRRSRPLAARARPARGCCARRCG